MRKFTKRSAAVVVAAAVGIGGAGAAWAFWTLGGGGTGTAAADSAKNLTVNGSTVTPLVPGQTSDVTLTVTNPNKFPVRITSISITSTGSDKTGCAGSNLEAVAGAVVPTTVIPAEASALPINYPGAIRMIADAANECQGAAFTLATTVGAQSAATPAP